MAMSNRKLAQLRVLKRGGDISAEGVLEGLPDLVLTKDTEGTIAANTIQVTGKLKDSATDLVFEVLDTGAGATATVATGTAKVGDGTTRVWLKPVAGQFKVNVLDAAAEDVLVLVTTSTGDTAMLMLTFA
jgi:hypothetical protein